MLTIDKVLIKILNLPQGLLSSLPGRDLKVLRSLAKIVSSPAFITENQSRLLLKILTENFENLGDIKDELSLALSAPTWSYPFRQVDKTKKLFITPHETTITVEFAFSSQIRKLLSSAVKELSNLVQVTAGRLYKVDLTESNIVKLVELLEPHGFEIDEKITDFYKIIKSWSETEVKNQFLLGNFVHTNFQKHITADIGLDTLSTDIAIIDRGLRYQYFLENTEKIPENLTEKLAFRKTPKVWVDKTQYTLDDIFESLKKLRRLPTLVIFDHNDHAGCLEELRNLNKSLEKNGISQGIGIYFRLPSDEAGSTFNKFIAEHQYNCELNSNTKVVGVQNGKIPKFFLKNDWKPLSVVSIGSSLKQTKTAVYANYSDLIISYTEQQPIIESKVLWE